MRDSVPERLFATYTDPAPTAMPDGSRPTSIVASTARVAGSIRDTVPSRLFATQIAPSPTAIGPAPLPTGLALVALGIQGPCATPDTDCLWSGASSVQATKGGAPPGSGLGGSADSLDGDGCQTNEAAAPDSTATGQGTVVVDATSVRGVSLALRSTYASVETTLDEAEVLNAVLPAGAPFTQDDLTCAKNQMIDELAARQQVLELMGYLLTIETNQQTGIDITLQDVAEVSPPRGSSRAQPMSPIKSPENQTEPCGPHESTCAST